MLIRFQRVPLAAFVSVHLVHPVVLLLFSIRSVADISSVIQLNRIVESAQNNQLKGLLSPRTSVSFSFVSTIHLVDIENLCRGNLMDAAQVFFDEYLPYAGYSRGDHVIIGTSHFSLAAFAGDARFGAFRFPTPRSGPNGADLVLLTELQDLTPGRYDKVVLGSGDGGFSAAMGEAGRSAHTLAVARQGSMSRRLTLAVHETRLVPQRIQEAA